jgi:hypothetical protein
VIKRTGNIHNTRKNENTPYFSIPAQTTLPKIVIKKCNNSFTVGKNQLRSKVKRKVSVVDQTSIEGWLRRKLGKSRIANEE